MAYVDDLLGRVADAALRESLRDEVDRLREARDFGLVFERHLPETVVMPGQVPRPGVTVQVDGRKAVQRVAAVDGDTVNLVDLDGTAAEPATWEDVRVVRSFGMPIYPGLTSVGRVNEGAADEPSHVVIKGENYHALELLTYVVPGKVDLCYIDPPYNTGNRDWKYNNDYVDKNDHYRHSKWLSFMEKRLLLTRELLNPETGVLVVTIDENEHAHLSVLLEQLFRHHDITSVSIVHNPRGVQGDNFSHTHETAVFVTPKGKKLLAARPLTPEEIKKNTSQFRNWGGESSRHDAANCFYPVLVRDGHIIGFGDDVTSDDSVHPEANEPRADGVVAIWPVDDNGVEKKWRYARQTVEGIQHLLVVERKTRGPLKGRLDLKIAKETGKYKTVWQDPKFDASSNGSAIVNKLVNASFDYPKSLYAVLECVRAVTANNPDALVLDYFGGSGTTAHAVALLNQRDGGRRQSILVTNNEVSEEVARKLAKRGLGPGDDAYEEHGIFWSVTKPRIEAAVLGAKADGFLVPGDYDDGAAFAAGLGANVEFFTLDYLDPDIVALGAGFAPVAPVLWLKAGGVGPCIVDDADAWALPKDAVYAVLFDVGLRGPFMGVLEQSKHVTHVFVVTDSEAVFQQVAAELPVWVTPVQLYEDYLRTFEINTRSTR